MAMVDRYKKDKTLASSFFFPTQRQQPTRTNGGTRRRTTLSFSNSLSLSLWGNGVPLRHRFLKEKRFFSSPRLCSESNWVSAGSHGSWAQERRSHGLSGARRCRFHRFRFGLPRQRCSHFCFHGDHSKSFPFQNFKLFFFLVETKLN